MFFHCEAAFTWVDYVAYRLIYIAWVPYAILFVTLSMPRAKSEHLLTRLAKASMATYLAFASLYLVYFILNPNTTLKLFILATQMLVSISPLSNDSIAWLIHGDIAINIDVQMMYIRQQDIPQIFNNKVFRVPYYWFVAIIDTITTLGGFFGFGVTTSLYLASQGYLTEFDTIGNIIALMNFALMCFRLYAKNFEVKCRKRSALREAKRREEEEEERRYQAEYEDRIAKLREEMELEKSKEVDAQV